MNDDLQEINPSRTYIQFEAYLCGTLSLWRNVYIVKICHNAKLGNRFVKLHNQVVCS